MYQITYGNQLLHDPLTDGLEVWDARLSQKVNAPAYLDLTISPTHPLAGVVRERDRTDLVRLTDDGRTEFVGWVDGVRTSMDGTMEVSCVSVLDALNDTVVRPYSTAGGDEALAAPSSPSGYFQWLVDQHNEHAGDIRFAVGENRADQLDPNGYILRSSSQRPSTGREISQKVLESLGGYLLLRYDGDEYVLDLWADAHDASAQVIDFGENLLDFAREVKTDGMATAVIPVGGTPEGGKNPVTLTGTWDAGEDGVRHDGDRIWSDAAVARWGWREAVFTDSEALTQEGLMASAVRQLRKVSSPTVTVECRAVDMSLYMDGYEPLTVGQVVRVRATPLGVDEYLMVSSIDLDLGDPSNSTYVLGEVTDTLTGRQSAFVSDLNASIDHAHDAVAALSEDTKALAGSSMVSQVEEFYQSTSTTELAGGMWSTDPSWGEGLYTWRRTLVTYGDGRSEYVPSEGGVCVAGNDGADGADAILLCLDSDNGTTLRNSDGSTTTRAVVREGTSTYSTMAQLRQRFGESVRVRWRLRPLGGAVTDVGESDPRLSELGMAITLTPADVDEGTVVFCDLESD